MRRPRIGIRSRAWTGALVALTAALVGGGCSAGPTTGSAQGPRWPGNPAWERYVMAPRTTDVTPVRVVRTSGDVAGAEAGSDPFPAAVRLTMHDGGAPPVIVVDYGEDVGGIPYFVVRTETGAPVLSATYSEGLQYTGPQGDDTASASPAGDTSRANDLVVGAAGRLSAGVIQGGERYERIALTTPGTVTLSSMGFEFTSARVTAGGYRGWFASSSPELDRIWYDGAYTTQLDELPARSVPAPWRISAGALYAVGGAAGVLRRGAHWSNYTMSFDTRVVDYSAGWVVRASPQGSGYLFNLQETGGRDTLQELDLGSASSTVIGDVALPGRLGSGRWHHVVTVVSGTRVTISIDGTRVSSLDTGSWSSGTPVRPSGSVGFVAIGSAAMFRDLVVTGSGGSRLYANTLSQPSALDDFPGPDVTAPDPLPVIVDGAKRDRVVWSGDLGVEIPNVFYTTAGADYVRQSLRLLGSYQVADGESGTNVSPTSPLGSFPQGGSTYSAPYSMDEVDNIDTYYLFTGDLSFVRAEWPMITRELTYNQSMVDSRGLLETDGTDGQDWDYYDGNKVGEVTAYNDIYYRTLVDAASMADALGLGVEAYAYAQEAARVRDAINRYLFDPSTGLYTLSDTEPAAVAQDGNALAVLFAVAPGDLAGRVLSALSTALPSTPYGPESFTADAGLRAAVSPFVTNEEVEALFATGDSAAALSLIRKVWGYMDAPGPDFTGADWELVGARGAPGFGDATSLAHGWASGATADLSSYVLGVLPATPGFRTWSVRPHPASLGWAEGQVPTPHGAIGVRWAQDRPAGRFSLQVVTPAGTRGVVSVPVIRPGSVVTVRSSGGARSGSVRKTIAAPRGATDVAVSVVGGPTYDFSVAPG